MSMNGSPTCRVFLFRHGETANAKQVCFNGHFDVGLSDRGKEQFQQIAESLKSFQLDGLYSSDLRRTREGAQTIGASHGLSPTSYTEMRELCFGDWEGLSIDEVNSRYPGMLSQRMQDIATFQVEGGESFPQLRDRVLPKFQEIVNRHSHDNVAIVSHGGVNRVILGHVLGIPIENIFRLQQQYAAVNIIQFYSDGNATVELIGGTHREIIEPVPVDKKLKIQ
jgi:alpha-ribazole phosphatase